MKRLPHMLLVIMFCSGCAELRVIGDATLRELRADAINVEQAIYQAGGRPSGTGADRTATALVSDKASFPRYKERPNNRSSAKQGLWMAGARLN
jgi:hypothetical protein